MNRIDKLFQEKEGKVLSVFITAGYPNLEDLPMILESLANSGADMVEIGIPYSDPLADGGTIQESNQQALANGMTLSLLFEQLEKIRDKVQIPLLLMGYLNPVLQYGVEKFCQQAETVGVDGVILPDLPMIEFKRKYREIFEKHGLANVCLITPRTPDERIRLLDEMSSGFLYAVSTDSTTGKAGAFGDRQTDYFQRIEAMKLQNPVLVGFGIHDAQTFQLASQYQQGAIIGSAFIRALKDSNDVSVDTAAFVHSIIGTKQPV
ncbi:tryptophan synthase subunit alpha [Pontibacter sp. G13]|uniref:tryptophan synthase subunit alpha n=1 Tax=Pontibacter sp. G13 TaxID=3074898 RepID=UPI00288A4787|nr:tryptophan synthase subunit alpha [Pontibacter sp. G13]WNJ19580.1 tryptophan synthase subunit alpha [Pontibacter sp. G13]